MSTPEHSPHADDNQLMAERRDKLAALRQQGIAFPNDVKPAHRAEELFALYDPLTKERPSRSAWPAA
jgi:lysyl-tRNA synthetase, class II